MSRISIINRSGGLTYGGSRSVLKHRDEFPILDFKELSICLQGCDFTANEDLVSRPTSQYIRSLFEQLLDTFMGFSPEYCVTATSNLLRSAANSETSKELSDDDISNDDTANTMHILVLFRAAETMLQTCGIHDFTLMDLMRPEPQRTRRILSAVINYARFREEHLRECEPLVRICESNMEEVRRVEDANNLISTNIGILKDRLEDEENGQDGHRKSTLVQLNNYNSRLELKLKKLQRSQEILKHEHGQYKEEKARLFEKLEDNHYLIGESTNELEKLKSYSMADPSLINRIVEELRNNLSQHEEQLRTTEEALRNKTRTVNSIQHVEDELRNLIKIVQEISNDLRKLQDERDKMVKQTDELEHKKHSSEELEVVIQRMKRRLQKSEEKIVKLKQQAQERDENAKDKLKALEKEYTLLAQERQSKEKKLDQTKAEINQLDTQIISMRNEFDSEWKSTESAVAKLNAHIKMYLSDINSQL
ncbi:CIC11C00000000727 [Sungouiella intermedia]|uniref:CIC11C00000000727 n=1 Tax=Sungouiella intermedia TaxID=45354 RepID=A0A1L0GJM4_9ASCO|nr:CIC11C00000000727 [[Candida] intermedia]